MLHGRRLDHALEHVSGSRYALVHAVAKRARQITLWLTADPAELRAEAAPPPVAGETVTRDPVALAETEILDGEVIVRWDPDGTGDDAEVLEVEFETDPLLIEGLEDEADEDLDGDGGTDSVTPALAQVLDTEEEADTDAEEADTSSDAEDVDSEEMLEAGEDDESIEVPLDEMEEDEDESEDE